MDALLVVISIVAAIPGYAQVFLILHQRRRRSSRPAAAIKIVNSQDVTLTNNRSKGMPLLDADGVEGLQATGNHAVLHDNTPLILWLVEAVAFSALGMWLLLR